MKSIMNNQAKVSLLVHTRNSAQTIKNLLESIKNQTYKNIEIIVVDNHSSDQTLYISRAYTKHIYTYGPERSAQRNYAAKKASGAFFLVPDADMILEENVVADCVLFILPQKQIKAIVIPEESIGQGFWAQCKKLERSFYVGVSWMEAARFFSKDIFEEFGGYDESNTGTEDYDLPQRIEQKYGKNSIGRISSFIYHDEGKLSLIRVLKKKFYYGQKLHIYKQRNRQYYKKQSSILKRFMLYLSQPKKLLSSPLIGGGMLCMKIIEFSAGGIGYLLRDRKAAKLYEAA